MRWVFLAPLALFAVVAGYFAVGLTRDPGTLPSALLNKPAPEFALPPLTDGKVEYADGTKATVDQMARDVTEFLTWAANPVGRSINRHIPSNRGPS